MDLLFLVGKLEELGVGCVQLFLREVVAEQFEPVYERRAAAAGRQGDDRLVEADVLRVDDLVGLAVFQRCGRRSPCWAARACSLGSTLGAMLW